MLVPDEVRRWLSSHGAPSSVEGQAIAQGYCRFYGLDLHRHQHEMGMVAIRGFDIFVQRFRRRSSHRGTVFLVHGYLDHSGLLGSTIRRLLDLAFDVVVYDQPGHGLSSGVRASIDTFQDYVDCLAGVHEFYQGATAPHIVMGHSLGGAVSMTFLLQHPRVFQKAILIAPLVQPAGFRWITVLHRLARRVIKRQPRLWRHNTQDASFRTFVREVDPLSPRFVPVQWVGAMLGWINDFHAHEPVETALLVVQGTDDGTVNWRTNIRLIRGKFATVKIHLVHEGKHHLLNEIDEFRESAWLPIIPFLTGKG